MAKTPITLTNLPGSDRMFNIPLNPSAQDYKVQSWSADTIDEDIKRSNLNGGVSTVEIVKRKTLQLNNIIYTEATRRMIEALIGSREPITVNPPWIDATGSEVLTYLSMQKTLDDWREETTRKAIAFSRLSSRYNSISGRKTAFGDPHWEDAPRGKGISVSDVINDAHEPNYELRSYLTQDAADSGATTLITVTPEQAVLWDNYGSTVWPAGNKAYLMISTEEEITNTFELALISAINTSTGLVTLVTTDGSAALAGTSDFTVDKRTYISSVLVSDSDMTDSQAQGSWADQTGPDLVEKSNSQQETGSRCLRVIGGAANAGVTQQLGELPAGTDCVVRARIKVIRGTAQLVIRNTTGGVNDLTQGSSDRDWAWEKYAFQVSGAGQRGLALRFQQDGGAVDMELLVDRVFIYQNCVVNGQMEADTDDVYEPELPVVTASNAATTTYAGNVCADAAAWNLANAQIGMYALESGGAYGRIDAVNDGADTITVDAWINGPPVNGNACEVFNAVAPDWTQQVAEAGDYFLQNDDDVHGGTYAQSIDVTASDEGIKTDANVFANGQWYMVDMFIKVASGTVKIIDGVANIKTGITDATYTAQPIVYEGVAARQMFIIADGAAAEWLQDDVMVVRLPGNPFESENYYDMAEPVEITGFTQVIAYKPDVANTALTVDAFLSEISRRTWDNNAHISIYYDESTNRFRMDIDDTVTTSVTINETFSAKDDIVVAARCDDTGAAGDVKLWSKVGLGTLRTGVDNGADILPGLTRMWLGRTAADFDEPARGTVSSVLFVNEVLTDAQVEAIINAMSGADVDTNALTAETHGIEYEIRRGGVTTRSTALGDEFRLADITLVELRRPAVFARQDA